MKLDAWKQAYFGEQMPACALQGHWASFRLVDETGSGKAYGGLPFTVHDSTGRRYVGKLNGEGFASLQDFYCGPVVLTLDDLYNGIEEPYYLLSTRKTYKLPITELQVRAERTFYSGNDGRRAERSSAHHQTDRFYQVEVSDLVRHSAHLPPLASSVHRPKRHVLKMMADLGFGPPQPSLSGVVLFPNQHSVLEVRPLRALRPVLSTEDSFCALNLYQLALFSALSYCDFGQVPSEKPLDEVLFPLDPSVGNLFAEQLSVYHEAWQIDPEQTQRFYPLYEEVPYSQRFEILPFDPELYPQNRPELNEEQEHPARLHFFDDEKFGTDTQAFIIHHDEVILISVRGTVSRADVLRDADAHQVAFVDGVGKAHDGFHQAYRAMRNFVLQYLDRFHIGQRIVICGHSLGGAIALLLAEMLRRRPGFSYDILLYTYGAPRAADQTFVDGASALTHHRMVNHNDPIPSVPGTQMDTKPAVMGAGLAVGFANAPLGVSVFFAGVSNLSGESFAHHGELHHFMPVRFENGDQASILWQPGCESINQRACNELLQQKNGLPKHRAFEPSVYILNHLMVGGYIPNSWATLRRWQESHEYKRPIVTSREFKWVSDAIQSMINQLEKSSRETRPDAYRRAHQGAIDAIIAEKGNLQVTRDRLATLRKVASSADVYGHLATNPQLLADTLNRWKANLANTAAEQLASTPPAVEDNEQVIAALTGGHAVGTPFHLDIDSIM